MQLLPFFYTMGVELMVALGQLINIWRKQFRQADGTFITRSISGELGPRDEREDTIKTCHVLPYRVKSKQVKMKTRQTDKISKYFYHWSPCYSSIAQT